MGNSTFHKAKDITLLSSMATQQGVIISHDNESNTLKVLLDNGRQESVIQLKLYELVEVTEHSVTIERGGVYERRGISNRT